MNLWNDESAAEATRGHSSGRFQASRVEIDSRRVQPGDLFIALKGEKFDGHEYVKDAFKKGAVAAMVSEPLEAAGPLLKVDNCWHAMEAMALYARARSKAKIVGVTGSVGKTSTREMIRLALAAHGKTFATSGNYNNHIGTPFMLANLPPDAAFAVFEMGMNHAGEISPLSNMVKPDVAVITNIEAVHLEFFSGIEGIADAKAEIFDGMTEGGAAVLNADNAMFARLAAAARSHALDVIACGEAKDADFRLAGYRMQEGGAKVTVAIGLEEVAFAIGALGKHWALSAILTLAAASALGLDKAVTMQALSAFREMEGRGNIVRLAGGALLIDDSYNASPASMRAAFAKTDEVWQQGGKKGRKIAALGEMLELGDEAPSLHAELYEDLEKYGFHQVYTSGSGMEHLNAALSAGFRGGHVAKAATLVPILRRELKKDDILLVKGSHGSHMYEVVKALLTTEAEEKTNAL